MNRCTIAALAFAAVPTAALANSVSYQFCREALPNILTLTNSVEDVYQGFWAVNGKMSVAEQARFAEFRDRGAALAKEAKAYREALIAACYPPK